MGLAFGGLLIISQSGVASAQFTPPSMTLYGAQRPAGMGGMRVGEGVYLRAGVAAEAGYDSNVFYSQDDPVDSATLRVTPSLELTNMNRDGTAPPFSFSLAASLLYREYLKEDEEVREQRAFNPTFSGSLGYNAGRGLSFSISDQFTRLEEPPYARGQEPIVRDANQAVGQVGLAPGGGRIQLVLRYTNTLDLFETDGLEFANRMGHDAMIDSSWRWLPKTALFLSVGAGYVQYLDDSAEGVGKKNSVPYRIVGGLRGLVTPKVTANFSAGFNDAIYDDAPGFSTKNPSGLSNLLATVSFTYTPITFTSLGLGYSHEFRDSPFIGDYYDLDAVGATINQQIGAFVLAAGSRYEFRRYQGFVNVGMDVEEITRQDHVIQTTVQADYFLQRWFYAGVGYAHLINRSSGVEGTAAGAVVGLDFTKHLIVGRLGISY
jgi:hypothetical protein